MLSLDDILTAQDLPIVEVEIPEWGGTVGIRPINGSQLDSLMVLSQQSATDPKKLLQFQKFLLIYCLVDDEGKPLLTDKTYAQLSVKNGAVINRLVSKCQEVCGLGDEGESEAAKKSAVTNGSSGGA